jgi:hypothetical protein
MDRAGYAVWGVDQSPAIIRIARRIAPEATFRRLRNSFRRSEETHVLRLYPASELIEELRRCGFRARKLAGYGRFKLPRGITGILAVKPHFG